MTSGAGVAPPERAVTVFDDALPGVERYADLLASVGVERGLLGPREVPRLWERHLMNCAVVEELVPHGSTVVDVGSGAGLPGVILGITRPDLSVVLLEPLLRRTIFLRECVEQLDLPNVTVWRGRAEEVASDLRADIVTARAVAPLAKLVGWSLPLLRTGGSLLALKGEQAETELENSRAYLSRQRPNTAEVMRVGEGKVDPATTVVRVTVTSEGAPTTTSKSRRAPGGKKKRGRKR